MQHCLPGSRKRPRTVAGRQATRLRGQLGVQIRDLRSDAGVGLRALAEAAGVDYGFLSRVERGIREPSISVLSAIAEALGADLSVRLYPNTGPIVRDHIQARMVEELLRIAHPRWRRMTEVPVYKPARGRIDVVLHDPQPAEVVATEVHSQVRRLEQQLGWAHMKAESLPSADFWRFSGQPDGRPAACHSVDASDSRTGTTLRSHAASGVSRTGERSLRRADWDRTVAGQRPALGRCDRRRRADPRSAAARRHAGTDQLISRGSLRARAGRRRGHGRRRGAPRSRCLRRRCARPIPEARGRAVRSDRARQR